MAFHRIFLLAFLISSTSALSIPLEAAVSVGLLPRADPVCGGNAGYTQCGGDFPSNFCCQTGYTCFGFNGNQSVICCPQTECPFVDTLPCDTEIYNATRNPTSPVHMEDLTQSAYTPCNGTDGCCPKGYFCTPGGCKINSVNAAVSSSPSSEASPTQSIGSLATTILSLSSEPTSAYATSSANNPSSTGGASAASSTNNSSPRPSETSSGPQFPIGAILIGLLPGLAVGCLVTLLLICCHGHRKARKLSSDSSSSLGPTVAKISDPIYSADSTTTRTDFLRHASGMIVRKASRPFLGGRNSDSSPTADSSISRMRSLFRKTPTLDSIRSGSNNLWGNNQSTQHLANEYSMPDPTPAAELAINARLGRANTESTTESPRTPRREPSMESIPIINNTPDAGGYERNTMFADLLPAINMRSPSYPVPTLPGPPPRKQTAGLMPAIYLGSRGDGDRFR